jgi:hypothetical protein
MPTTTSGDSAFAAGHFTAAADHLQDRLAEAASYAVLRRIAPVLRHDVAGFMQPIGMLMMVLQRRVQMPEPDLQAIAKNVASVSALTKEATSGCMNAMGWMASRETTGVSLHSSVDEAAKLLAMELSSSGLEISNAIEDESIKVPESFFRSVLMGALLAFCDQRTAGSILRVSLAPPAESGINVARLELRMEPDDTATPAESTAAERKARCIEWADVEAMASTFGAHMSRGEGWLTLDLPVSAPET